MPDLRVLVLASGSGTLFQALADNQIVHSTHIVGLITDKICPALERADASGIESQVVDFITDRVKWDKNLVLAMDAFEPELIVSAGFMRVLGPAVLTKYQGQIINTHPALLPNFPGAHAVRDALLAGVKNTGSTIHYVDSGVDTGEIIIQRQVEIFSGDTEETLHSRIKEVERELLVKVVSDFGTGKIKIKPRSTS